MKLSMRMRRIATFRWSTRPTRLRSTRDCAYRGEGEGTPRDDFDGPETP